MAPALVLSREGSVAWSASARKLFYFGGDTGSSVKIQRFNAYSYDKAGWKDLRTKLIYFGGYTMDRVELRPEIFLFDVATLTWTNGTIPPKKDQRGAAACGVSGDYFITWGGIGGFDNDGLRNTTAVYNMKTNLWTSSYVAAPISTTSTLSNSILSPTSSEASSGTPSSSSGNSSDNSHRTIVIVAGVLGVVVAALVVCAFLLYRRHRRRRLQVNTHKPRDPSGPNLADDHGRNPHESPVKDKFSSQDIGRGPHPWDSHLFIPTQIKSDPHTSLPIEVPISSPTLSYSSNPIAGVPAYHHPITSDTIHSSVLSKNSTPGDKAELDD
ncbi:hypothetical protein BGX34_006797 [Mortierella sp. NVP85]|nr:hypothetical protein BGX34_006797 [Mortierella sp. NVP85]